MISASVDANDIWKPDVPQQHDAERRKRRVGHGERGAIEHHGDQGAGLLATCPAAIATLRSARAPG
jgi:hypothetical protein